MLKGAAAGSCGLAVAAAALYGRLGHELWLTLAITFGTVAYHLGMRLLVGWAFTARMGNRADCQRPWYRLRPWEAGLYRALRVRAWKGRLPTYDPALFSPKAHTWSEIAQAMCQAELVHETCAVLSFLPLLAAGPFGALPVFLATSACGAALDLACAAAQRYNRDRVLALLRRCAVGKNMV